MKSSSIFLFWFLVLVCRTGAVGQGLFESIGGLPGGADNAAVQRMKNGDLVAVESHKKIYRMPAGDSIWQQVTGFPGENSIFPVEFNLSTDGNIYLENNAGHDLYRSENSGSSWEKVSDNFGFPTIHRQIINADGRFITLSDSGLVQVSDDFWINYTPVADLHGVPAGLVLCFNEKILATVKNSSNQYAVWLGDKNGENWTKVATKTKDLEAIQLKDSTLFLSDGQRSFDGGLTWESFTMPFSGSHFTSFGEGLNSRLLVLSKFGLWFSDNHGDTWQKSNYPTWNQGGSLKTLPTGEVFVVESAIYFSNSENGERLLYRTSDNGLHWQPFAKGMDFQDVGQIFHDKLGRVWARSQWHIWRKSETSNDWNYIYQNSLPASVFNISWDFGYFFVNKKGHIFSKFGSKNYRSTDDGKTFSAMIPAQLSQFDFLENLFYNPVSESIFTQVVYGAGIEIFKSVDGGDTWTSKPSPAFFYNIVSLKDGKFVARGDDGAVYQSSDDGETWNNVAPTIPITSFNGFLAGNDDNIYAKGDGEMAFSKNKGAAWTVANFPNPENASMAVNSVGHIYISQFLSQEVAKIYRSFDSGKTWSEFPQEIPKPSYLYFDENDYLFIGTSEKGIFKSVAPLNTSAVITGKIQLDKNQNCQPDSTDQPLKNLIIEAKGKYNFYAKTDSSGNFEIVVDTGQYLLQPKLWNQFFELCPPAPLTVALADSAQTIDSLSFVVASALLCPYFEVSISTPMLRRCFETDYHVSYCNYGTADMDDALAQVVLDPNLTFVGAVPLHTQSGDTLFFPLGSISAGDCGRFKFRVLVNCDDTQIGQTLCVAATIFADTACVVANGSWSGASIRVRADCIADTLLQFTIENVGTAPTSPGLEYIIIEDQIVLRGGSFDLAPGVTMTLTEPADGSTWRIEAEQEPFHPGFSMPSAAVEGCGGLTLPSLVNWFSADDADPFVDRDCREIVGSWDPNDKQGFPQGFGNQHFIRPTEDLEYFIRFQNTGTDTAFRVVVLDTLSPLLDAGSLRWGASSHPFDWEIFGKGILKMTFRNILLPDSNINEPASHGFVRFRISQKPDLPLGSRIENRAAIFFDFNPAVLTNTTFHTVDTQFVLVKSIEIFHPKLSVQVFPNPFFEKTTLKINGLEISDGVLQIFDVQNRQVRTQNFSGKSVELQRGGLAAGFYFFTIFEKGKILAGGKMEAH